MKETSELIELYPRVFFACHRRHTRDPKTGVTLTQRQVAVLQHLDSVEPVTVARLARHLGVTPATMSVALDRLETLSCVERHPSATDRRVVNVLLTDLGQRIKEAETVLDPDLVDDLLSRLSSSERAAAIEGLRLLASAADRRKR